MLRGRQKRGWRRLYTSRKFKGERWCLRGLLGKGLSESLWPEDICHRRQLALSLWRGGAGQAGWASEAAAEAAVGTAHPGREGGPWR